MSPCSQDPRVSRGKLVYQWPQAQWPNDTLASGDAPFPAFDLAMAPCNASDPTQAFVYNTTDQTLRTGDGSLCLSYLGYHEANTHITACQSPPWCAPGIGCQQWTQQLSDGTLRNVGNPGKVSFVWWDASACHAPVDRTYPR
jgi:hypothetical protein